LIDDQSVDLGIPGGCLHGCAMQYAKGNHHGQQRFGHNTFSRRCVPYAYTQAWPSAVQEHIFVCAKGFLWFGRYGQQEKNTKVILVRFRRKNAVTCRVSARVRKEMVGAASFRAFFRARHIRAAGADKQKAGLS
jgi:hypothetical protein